LIGQKKGGIRLTSQKRRRKISRKKQKRWTLTRQRWRRKIGRKEEEEE